MRKLLVAALAAVALTACGGSSPSKFDPTDSPGGGGMPPSGTAGSPGGPTGTTGSTSGSTSSASASSSGSTGSSSGSATSTGSTGSSSGSTTTTGTSGSSGTSASSSSGTTGSTGGTTGSTGTVGTTFDPTQVYMVAFRRSTLDELVADSAGNMVDIGFSSGFSSDFQLDSSGQLIYVGTDQTTATNTMSAFVADDWGTAPPWTYPTSPQANDVALPTSACDATGGPSAVLVGPSGKYVYQCSDNSWHDGLLNTTVFTTAGEVPESLGIGAQTLVEVASGTGSPVLSVDDGAGTVTPVVGVSPTASTLASRSRADGWAVVQNEFGVATLYHVDFQGNATVAATYATLPATVGPAVVDTAAQENLYLLSTDPNDSTAFALLEFAGDGSAAVVRYTTSNQPPDDLSGPSPVVYPKPALSSHRLITGP